MAQRYYNALTGRENNEATMFRNIETYTVAREVAADRFEYALGRMDAATSARSERYWSREVAAARGKVEAYDAALSVYEEQLRAVEPLPGAAMPSDIPAELAPYWDVVDVPGDWSDDLDDVEALEWEFGEVYEWLRGR